MLLYAECMIIILKNSGILRCFTYRDSFILSQIKECSRSAVIFQVSMKGGTHFSVISFCYYKISIYNIKR